MDRDGQTVGWIDRWIDRHGWMNGWMDRFGWIDGQTWIQ